jgi:lipopolysaccharide assembly outer membrane protein LptD (OstA)
VIVGEAMCGLRSAAVPRMLAAAMLYASTALYAPVALAQSPLASIPGDQVTNPNAQMLLEADQLVYENDAQLVIVTGNVRIDYDGNQLVARKVTYNQRTGRQCGNRSARRHTNLRRQDRHYR